jgi:hypothetical protein
MNVSRNESRNPSDSHADLPGILTLGPRYLAVLLRSAEHLHAPTVSSQSAR